MVKCFGGLVLGVVSRRDLALVRHFHIVLVLQNFQAAGLSEIGNTVFNGFREEVVDYLLVPTGDFVIIWISKETLVHVGPCNPKHRLFDTF